MIGSGRLEAGIHRFLLRVYYEDTDAGGVVYHATYLRFAERARTEMLRCARHRPLRLAGAPWVDLRRAPLRGGLPRPARLDDLLEVATSLERLGGASLDLRQIITRSPIVNQYGSTPCPVGGGAAAGPAAARARGSVEKPGIRRRRRACALTPGRPPLYLPARSNSAHLGGPRLVEAAPFPISWVDRAPLDRWMAAPRPD